MLFKEYLDTLNELKDFEIEIVLNSWELYLIENKIWKQWSLRVVQNHLWLNSETNEKIDLTNFCEFYEEWKQDKNTHQTIGFLDKFNRVWGVLRKVIRKLHFTKSEWTWNDFVILDFFDWKLDWFELTAKIIRKICDRNFGIWSDWIVIVYNWVNHKFAYRMFNPDWSEAEMCGNWIRCYMKYLLYKWYLWENKTFVETKKWVLHLSLINGLVVVDMWKPILIDENIPVVKNVRKVISKDREFDFTPISMWNPHAIIFLQDDLYSFDLINYWKPIESNTTIFPNKMNVEFINVNSKNDINMRVFERWAWETLACWTWACASVVAWIINWYLDKSKQTTVHLKWGDLNISWAWWIDDSVIMSWPANIVFEGEFIL